MQRERVTRRSQAAMVVGWVSNTDAIFLGLILTLTVTLFVAARLQRSERQNRQLQDEVTALQGQLAQRETLVAGLQTDKTRIIQLGRQHIADLKSQLSSLQDQYAADKSQFEADNEKRRAEVAAYRKDNERLRTVFAQTATEGQVAAVRLVAAIEERDVARHESKALRSHVEAEPGLHKELIGLKGKLGKVAVVFDTSGSMANEGRWEQARGVVATWLEHLAISECALVLFSTGVEPFPEDGRFLSVHGPQGEANRQWLLKHIESTKPDGGTNTLLALQTAYRCPGLDTVILFTDGEPNNGDSDRFDPEIARQIYELCRQHKDIPVNTIGLGNYFKPELSRFLMRVARETGGNFLGR